MGLCPSARELDLFVASGRTDTIVVEHVASCAVCQRKVESMEDDLRLVSELREACDADPLDTTPRVDGYEILGEIHRGGQGIVFRGVQRATKRPVALKLLRDGAFATASQRLRFEREIEIVAQMDHPCVVTVYDSGRTPSGEAWLAMEYIDGAPLDRSPAVQRGRRSLLELFVAVCDAVQAAHRRGVLHRDLKPANVLVDAAGRPHVLDFGLAKEVGAPRDGDDLTRTGAFLGTLAYAAPEQVSSGATEVDVRTDVYALGVMLYELLTGRLPYAPAGAVREWVQAICEEAPPAPGREVDPELETVLRKALAKDPERRYQSAGELGRDLGHYLAGEPIDARRDSTWYVLRKSLQRNRVKAVIGSVVIVLVLASTVVSAVFWRRAVEAAELAHARSEVLLPNADAHRLRQLVERAEDLWPAHPERVTDYETWIADAEDLASRLPEHRAALLELRIDALPWTDEEQARDDATHPRREELERKIRRKRALERSLEELPPDGGQETPEDIDRACQEVDDLAVEIPVLARLVATRRTYTFEDPERQRWHDTRAELVEGLAALAAPGGIVDDVRARVAFATQVEEASVSGPEAVRRWREAIEAIADEERHPAYGGLVLRPQIGLLPIGPDPVSGLWEFVHLQTGVAPGRDAETGAIELEERTGLVFVLIPGGTFWMGSQSLDANGRNYDPMAVHDEGPVHEVSLDPFFLSKYEMNQAQYVRVTRENPSGMHPPLKSGTYAITLLHPVERITWYECDDVTRQLGLRLPTEAQWEFAARAGTSTPYWTGFERETLQGAINIADASAARSGANWEQIKWWPGFDDGFGTHAPVDHYRPNPFGLHNVLGNVNEWMADWKEPYSLGVREGDGEREPDRAENRAYRGGAYLQSVATVRCADRAGVQPEYLSNGLGLRPARPLDPDPSRESE